MARTEIDKRFSRLDELATLKDGWFDGEGLAPTAVALAQARIELRSLLLLFNVAMPAIFPTPAGGLTFEWGADTSPVGRVTDVEFFADGHADWWS